MNDETNIIGREFSTCGKRLYNIYDHGDKFRDYVCTVPLHRMELHDSGAVSICCVMWSGYIIGNWREQSLKDIWTSEQALKMRQSTVLDRTFKYCNCKTCPRMQNPDKELVLTPRKTSIIKLWQQHNIIPAIDMLMLSIDRSCQLSCPSCRPELIYHADVLEKDPALKQLSDDIVKMYNAGEIKCIRASGSGDPFISLFCRKIMDEVIGVNGSTFEIATNGLGFTEKWYNEHPNMHRLISTIEISIDAGTEETYKIVRRGGSWKVLMKNLEFISTLNKNVIINIVVQKSNYREIPQMYELCKRYGFKLKLAKLLYWPQAEMKDYNDMAIWQTTHPEHEDFIKILEIINFNDGVMYTHNLTEYIRGLDLLE